MVAIKVPRVSANEDVVSVLEINKDKNELCRKDEIVCVLESTKSVFELAAKVDGHIVFVVEVGAKVEFGQTIAYIDSAPINLAHPLVAPTIAAQSKIVVTKKAQILLDAYSLMPEDVISKGVLRSSDVEKYLQRGKEKTGEVAPDYQVLEKVMKSYAIDGVDVSDVERLKKVLSFAMESYSQQWNRTIPVLDVLFDRWAIGKEHKFGEGTNLSHLSYIQGDVNIGNNTYIGPFTILDGGGGLEIGDNCSIAAGVHIYSHDTIARALSGPRVSPTFASTRVGHNCFIGPHAVISKGVSIGDHSFVAANSVVTSDVSSYTAVQGNPAQPIGTVYISEDGSVSIEPLRARTSAA